jgi:hypothetical protein
MFHPFRYSVYSLVSVQTYTYWQLPPECRVSPSGDTIMEELARRLAPSAVGFITDVAGVYDKPPAPQVRGLLAFLVQTYKY